MKSGKIRVVIVEDSLVVQRLLEHVIHSDPRLQVVGKAADADEALAVIQRMKPDIVTMDIRLPRVNGFEATRRIMAEHPVPIVVVASNVDDAALGISMNALRAGALSVVEKPAGTGRLDYADMAKRLCTQLVIMSQIKVVRQRRGPALAKEPPPAPPEARSARYRIVGIAASTGGPPALARILGALPADFPLPVVVVQHIGAPFVAGFASWLGSVVRPAVTLAREGEQPSPGHVYVAPGAAHLTVTQGRFHLTDAPPRHGQIPSGDVLLESLAEDFGREAIGMVLTGMGEDGARGLLAMRKVGGWTIAEHPSSAVVWGMPGTAVRFDAAVEQLPQDAMAARLLDLTAAQCPPPHRQEASR